MLLPGFCDASTPLLDAAARVMGHSFLLFSRGAGFSDSRLLRCSWLLTSFAFGSLYITLGVGRQQVICAGILINTKKNDHTAAWSSFRVSAGSTMLS